MSTYTSIREEFLAKLNASLPEIQGRFGIETIGIFGSVARGEDTPESDVDVLYTFQEGQANLDNLLGLKEYLEDLFNRKIDLVSRKWVKPVLYSHIAEDVILCGGLA
jgi:predicted nucleotidyltransferase